MLSTVGYVLVLGACLCSVPRSLRPCARPCDILKVLVQLALRHTGMLGVSPTLTEGRELVLKNKAILSLHWVGMPKYDNFYVNTVKDLWDKLNT